MSPASPSLQSSDSRLRWKKRKRESVLKRKKPKEEEEEDEEEEDDPAAAAEEDGDGDDDDPGAAGHKSDPVLDLRGSEVLSGAGQRISDFPAAFRRSVSRPHPAVLSLAAVAAGHPPPNFASATPFLENISHGQLQALSAVLPDNPSLLPPSSADADKPYTYVCTSPALMDGRGVSKMLPDGRRLFVPMHSDWFSLSSVNRLERQVVPHYFSGKSADHTPEKYISLRNKIVFKYMENPGRRLSFNDFQGLVSGCSSSEVYDLSRIVRFLDNWGVINYLAAHTPHRGLNKIAGLLLREDAGGELQVHTPPLKSIDGLIQFDRPKCNLKAEDVALLSSSSCSVPLAPEAEASDLDNKIMERLSEHSCSYCSQPLPNLQFQSRKEADTMLCSDCFNNANFIIGHSSVDFVMVDSSSKDLPDSDGDYWTDQETLLLLEALERYNDNWNEIAEHVGSKSKAQCILHFLRLPMEDGLLENIEIPCLSKKTDISNGHHNGSSCSNSNGNVEAVASPQGGYSESQLPFANSTNPVMSMVAFLASAIGPRVAAACASASLSVLTRDDFRPDNENDYNNVGLHGASATSNHQKDEDRQVSDVRSDSTSLLSAGRIKVAALSGLSAAATKAKLFADQEEREIQRLAATIINHQLKRLELKLKQFAEVETLLLKKCELVERSRQRLATERVRMMSGRFGPTGTSLPSTTATPAPASALAPSQPPSQPTANPNTRHLQIPNPSGQAGLSSVHSGNPISTMHHPNMQLLQQRQQQMLGFGPRLPLSAIHQPAQATPSPTNTMFNSGAPRPQNPNNLHPLMRSSSAGNANAG